MPLKATFYSSQDCYMMFDPASVKKYKLFRGDARDVLRTFKPGSVHSIYATPAVYTGLVKFLRKSSIPDSSLSASPAVDAGLAESAAENTALHELFYKVLHESGSLFTNATNVDMERMGWIRQHDLDCQHYTKSNDFYREFNDVPIEKSEDYAKARRIMKVGVDGSNAFLDVMCNFYTPPGGITMDPTMGDGPHVIAALQRGRRAIGIERVDHMYDTAIRRLALYEVGTTVA